MRIHILIAGSIAALALTAATPAKPSKPLNYDCTKAGNANKTACKGKVATAPAKAIPAVAKNAPPAPKPAGMKPAAPAMKPAAHRAAAAPAGRMVTATQKSGRVVQYNCDKKGNAAKTACKR